MSSATAGTLYIVSTPIGNLRDITLRALDTLRAVSLIAAEDTRKTRKLLTAYDIHSRLISLHANSSAERLDRLLDQLADGTDMAYVTDAGCPALSDPGAALIDAAHKRGIVVRVIPGPSAVTAAIALSGLPAAEFRFLGFLPRSRGKRESMLRFVGADQGAFVLFEAPSRVRSLLESLMTVLPDRRVAVCREITKIYEEVIRGNAATLLESISENPKGEFTIVVGAGNPPSDRNEQPTTEDILQRARALRASGSSTKNAAKTLAAEFGMSKKQLYQLIIQNENNDEEL